MNAVLDTVIFVRALINPASQCGRLVFDFEDAYDLIVSPQLTAEYVEVLGRRTLVRRFPAAGTRSLATVMQILDRAQVVHPAAVPRVSRDPTDDKFLAAALAGNARFIVSDDDDLLVLGSYEGVSIVSAQAFLAVLEQAAGSGG